MLISSAKGASQAIQYFHYRYINVKFSVETYIADMSNGKFGSQCQCQCFLEVPFSMSMSMPMFLLEGFSMSILFQVLYQCNTMLIAMSDALPQRQ